MVRCLQAERCWHQTSNAVIGQKEETQRLAEVETCGQQPTKYLISLITNLDHLTL